MSREILVLGAQGSGKTLFIRNVQNYLENIGNLPCRFCNDRIVVNEIVGSHHIASESTIPTVGVELTEIELDKEPFSMREIGAVLCSKWDTYLMDKHCVSLIFIIDISDSGMLGTSLVLLHELLVKQSVTTQKPILIVLNKTDMCNSIAKETNKNYLQLQDLQMQWGNIIIVEGTCLLPWSACEKAVNFLQTVAEQLKRD